MKLVCFWTGSPCARTYYRIANLYYALFLYADFFIQDTVYIVQGMPQPHYGNALCQSPGWESAGKG